MSMPEENVIEVNNLSKYFRIYSKPRDMLTEVFTNKSKHTIFNALNDISFTVKKGEVVGVIGRNGAGKSTLLKILTGTLDHSAGNFKIKGKISAILELGTGFHPDYTGRENIYMGGLCAGMSEAEIDRKLESIIEFSELRDVIDRPFKTYSSGMKARLTFSVAISVEPDVFIIDEALAAGDAIFVAKCFKKITEICQSGTTVFFVTHSTELIRRLCHRCIYLKNGAIYLDGSAENVSSIYDVETLEIVSDTIASKKFGASAGSGPAHIVDLKITNSAGKETNGFFQHDSLLLNLKIRCDETINNPPVLFKFTRTDGILATSWMNTEPQFIDLGKLKQGFNEIVFAVDDLLLGDGEYDLTIALFPERLNKTEMAFYADPMTIWEKTHRIVVRRRGRPLSTFFDQPIQVRTVKYLEELNLHSTA